MVTHQPNVQLVKPACQLHARNNGTTSSLLQLQQEMNRMVFGIDCLNLRLAKFYILLRGICQFIFSKNLLLYFLARNYQEIVLTLY